MTAIQCTVRFFYLGALLILVGTVLFTSFSFTVLLPHVRTRHWPSTRCVVKNSTYLTDTCACSQLVTRYNNCHRSFPCLQVQVSFAYRNFTYISDSQSADVIEDANDAEITANGHDGHDYVLITGVLYRKWKEAFQKTVSHLG